MKHCRDENINMANLQIQPAVKPSAKLIHIPRYYLSTFPTRGSDFCLIICKSFQLYVYIIKAISHILSNLISRYIILMNKQYQGEHNIIKTEHLNES